MFKSLFFILILTLIFSCGKNADQKTADAVLSANIALSKGNCQHAIDLLEENGRANSNAIYLKTLASAYACRANYSTVTFFASDIGKTITPAPLGGTTTYSTSSATVQSTLQNDAAFTDLQTAINILLYAGGISTGIDPTTAERAKHFTASEVADIDSQLLYMVLVQVGRYGHFYGNSSATGVKGSGTGTNTCFTSYVNAHPSVKAAIAGSSGVCTNSVDTTAAHAQIVEGVTAATRKQRMCEGVVLLNNVYALLPNVIASIFTNPADQVAARAAIANINTAKGALTTADPTTTTVLFTLNQSICEDNSLVSVSNIESYFGIMFEGSFQ
jgi:hypothetical protein